MAADPFEALKRLALLLAAQLVTALFNPQLSVAKSTPEIVADTKPAIVLIVAYDISSHPFGLGTGFFVQSPSGTGTEVVTNNHVIQDAAYLKITGLDGIQYTLSQVIARNEANDLAVLSLSGVDNHSYLKLNSSVVEGQNILAIGNPEGLQGTVSPGIISAIRPDIDRYQITAPISPGSSGSPVLNEDGEVIGVVASYYKEGQNLNFAIPASRISYVRSSWLKRPSTYPMDVAQMPPPVRYAAAAPRATTASTIDSATFREIANLVFGYMHATQNGKPVSLYSYCTLRLVEWYGQKDLTIQQAEKSIADYYKTWPNQDTRFDPSQLRIKAIDGQPNLYTAILPFDWSASNGRKSQTGHSVLQVLVTLTTNGYGYRIVAVMNHKGD